MLDTSNPSNVGDQSEISSQVNIFELLVEYNQLKIDYAESEKIIKLICFFCTLDCSCDIFFLFVYRHGASHYESQLLNCVNCINMDLEYFHFGG
jgi:hypothetical protein